jgi:hypothetical protein
LGLADTKQKRREQVIEALEQFEKYWPVLLLSRSLDKELEERLWQMFGGARGGCLYGPFDENGQPLES